MTPITEDEKMQRRLAVESSIGTHAIEGIRIDADVRSIMDAFAEGELTLEQFSAAMDAQARDALRGDRVLEGAA